MGHAESRIKRGFTIIEVMIVLAIAGLIMMIVLVAIPQLQRNQRNAARKDKLGRVKVEIDNYSSNNTGKIPSTAADLTDLNTRYLSDANIDDPRESSTLAPTIAPSIGAVSDKPGIAYYATSAVCNGEQRVAGTARQYALWTTLEGGAIFCLDNK